MASDRSLISRYRTLSAGAQPTRLGLALVVIAVAQVMVVIDTTIVTVALPHVQRALGFSSAGLEWVVNLYALVFAGLLLLGGRIGDMFGRRRVLIGGLGLFCLASLLGGLAQSQLWLLAARAVQGVGAAIVAPAVLALVIVNFPEGAPRNRATGVYAAMGALGGSIGLLLGGILTTYASWRWTLFVNVPIGLALALAAPLVLAETPRQRVRFDVPGAVTVTAGIVALVYGVSAGAPNGPYASSHWGSANVIVALAGSVVLLAAFVLIERRTRSPLLPLRLFSDRNRVAGYLTAAVIGGAFFGVLYFLTLYFQEVWGYSAVRSGLGYLPWVVTFGTCSSLLAARLLPRVGPRPLLIVGSLLSTGGLFWLSRIGVHSSYWAHVFGPLVLAAGGFGVAVVSLVVLAISAVHSEESGVASSLLNVGQEAGGSVAIAALGTVAWTIAAHRIAAGAHRPAAASAGALHVALADGFQQAFLVTAGLALLILVVAVALVRVKAQPAVQPAAAPEEARAASARVRSEPALATSPCAPPQVAGAQAICEQWLEPSATRGTGAKGPAEAPESDGRRVA